MRKRMIYSTFKKNRLEKNKIWDVERYLLDEYQTIPQISVEYSPSPLTPFTLLTDKEFTVLGVTLEEKHQEHSQREMKWSNNGIFLQWCISEVVPGAVSVRLPERRGVIVLPHSLVHTREYQGLSNQSYLNKSRDDAGCPSNLKFTLWKRTRCFLTCKVCIFYFLSYINCNRGSIDCSEMAFGRKKATHACDVSHSSYNKGTYSSVLS